MGCGFWLATSCLVLPSLGFCLRLDFGLEVCWMCFRVLTCYVTLVWLIGGGSGSLFRFGVLV